MRANTLHFYAKCAKQKRSYQLLQALNHPCGWLVKLLFGWTTPTMYAVVLLVKLSAEYGHCEIESTLDHFYKPCPKQVPLRQLLQTLNHPRVWLAK